MRRISEKAGAASSAAAILVLAFAPAAVLWMLRAELPAEVATHWGVTGEADAWQSLTGALLTGATMTAAIPLLLVALGVALHAASELGGVAVGTGAFLTTIFSGGIWAQRDSGEPVLGVLILISLLVGVAAGIAYWLLLRVIVKRPGTAGPETGPAAPTLEAPAGARLAWTGNLRTSGGASAFAAVLTVSMLAFAVFAWISVDMWFGIAMLLLTLVLIGGFSALTGDVVIDADGVRVTTFGIRILRAPLSELRSAETTHVEALGDYGGWGWRLGHDGRTQGMVSSRGEALMAHRQEGRSLVLTLDGAEGAATALNALIARDRARR